MPAVFSNQKDRRVKLISACIPVLESLEERRLFSASTIQTLPFALDFGSDRGELVDKDGQGTGFTLAQPNKNGDQYQPALIDLDTTAGVLKLTTTGSGTNGSNSGSDNTQVNALETSFDGTTAGFAINARLKGPLTNLSANYQQGGIFFGPDQDNFVKLVAIHTDSGQVLQFKDEQLGSTTAALPSAAQNYNIGSFSSITSLDLRLVGDASTGKVTAFYAINGGSFKQIPYTLTLSGSEKTAFFTSSAKGGVLQSQKNNLAPVTITYDSFGITAGSPVLGHPSVTATRPADGDTNVSRDSFVAADVNLPTPGAGVDASTLSTTTVMLYRTSDHTMVPGVVNTTGGGDAIIYQPTDLLLANTSYTFQVTSGVKDTAGSSFVPYTATFTTGTSGGPVASNISFDKVSLTSTDGSSYTSVEVGPDHKLYATTIDGHIIRWTINNDGTLGASQTIDTIITKEGGARALIGLVFDPKSTASNLIAYVSNNAPSLTNAPDWSGKITKLTGSNLQTATDLVVNLPRSIRDHMTNQMVFGPDGALYISQASVSAMGAPDNAWGLRSEHLLNAAILRLDLTKLGSSPLNVQTEGVANPYNPYASGAPLTIYASGVRNSYDLIWSSTGHLYASTNGSASNGATPASPDGTVKGINPVTQTEDDFFYDIVQGKYYGHPNPTRGEYVQDGGNPTSAVDNILSNGNYTEEFTQYPVGTKPDSNYEGSIWDYGKNYSPDGMIEYKGNAFGGALNGKILVTRYSGGDDIIILTPSADGSKIVSAQTGANGMTQFVDPLDITEDMTSGFLYVAEYGGQKLTLLRPTAAGADISASKSTFEFNDVASSYTGGSGSSPTQTLTLTNSGTGTLSITSLVLGGTNAGQFSLVNPPTTPITVGAGQSINLQVAYTANAVGIQTATLTVNSNAANSTALTIALRGLGTTGQGSTNEPSLQRILDLYQIPVTVGDPDPSTTDFPASPSTPNDEVVMPRLAKAGSGQVSIELLSVFANSKTPAIDFGYYQPGTPTTQTQLFNVGINDAQSVNPTAVGNTTFDPGSASFGLWTTFPAFTNRQSYSEDSLNKAWDPTNPRKVRFYPLKNSDGSVVPNAYIFAFEDYNVAYDFNDVVGIIRNVKAAPAGPIIGLGTGDGQPVSGELVFSRILNLDTIYPNTVHDTSVLTINNTGSSTLNISSLVLSDTTHFQIVGNPSSLSIAAGSSANITVKFVGTGPDLVDVINATLTLNSNDTSNPALNVKLSGAYQQYSEMSPSNQYGEPTLTQVVNGVFGYTTNLYNAGQTVTKNGVIQLGNEGSGAAIGEEVLSPYWLRADANAPVTVQQIAAYHSEHGTDPSNPTDASSQIFYYYQGASTTTTKLFRHQKTDGQTLLPHLSGSLTQYAIGTFAPTANKPFGLKVDSRFSDDSLNPLDNNVPNTGHAIRFYPARDANGQVIPNTYIVAQDYTGLSYSNYDYQDNIYIIRNVMPTSAPVTPTGLTATGGSNGVALKWKANSAGNVAGYNVYRATDPNGTFTLLNSVLLTGTTYTDILAPSGVVSYYKLTAVDNNGLESGAATASATSTGTGTGTAPTAPSGLTASPSASSITLNWVDNSSNETGFQIMRKIGAGGTYAPLTTTAANVTNFVDTSVSSGNTYYYQVIAVNGAGNSSASNEVNASLTQSGGTFTGVDIGNPTPGSTVTINDGTDYNVTGGGADVYGTGDQFQFAYEQLTGDFDKKVQIQSLDQIDTNTMAGLMARETLTGSSRNVYMKWRAASYRFNYRSTTGGTTGAQGSGSGTTPNVWVRLVRSGNTFTGYSSSDGTNWTLVGSTTMSLPSTVYFGMAVSAHDATATATAQFRNLSDTSATVGVNPPSNLVATAAASSIGLTWDDNSSNEDGFIIERRSNGGAYGAVFTTAANATSWTDTNVVPGTTYTYHVIAKSTALGNSSASNESSATIQSQQSDSFTSSNIGDATGGSTTVVTPNQDYDITANGSNIFYTVDGARFTYEQLSGDFDMKVRIASVTTTNSDPLVGLMARASLDANSVNAIMRTYGSSPNQYKFGYRTTTGGSTTSIGGGTNSYPNTWVRLTRSGDTLTGYYSSNGTNWTQLSSITLSNVGSTMYVGMTVASRASTTETAQFRDLSVTQPTPPPSAPSGLSATAGVNKVDLSWTDNSSNESGFIIERSTGDNAHYAPIFTTAANATSYTDSNVVAGTQYFYRVSATNVGGTSSPSNEDSATPTAPVTINLTSAKIGTQSASGTLTTVTPNKDFDLSGGGSDVWNTSDQLQFAYTQLTGDFDIKVRVADATTANGNPLVGLMARASLDTNSINAFMRTYGQAGGTDKFAYRGTTGGTTTSVAGSMTNSYPNTWLRLVRSGNTLTGYASNDGQTWTNIGSTTIATLPSTLYVGLAVSSRSSGLESAEFRDLSIA